MRVTSLVVMTTSRHPRRSFLRGDAGHVGLGATGSSLAGWCSPATGYARAVPEGQASDVVRPPRLRTVDRVGLVNPASAAFDTFSIVIARESLMSLGLRPVIGPIYFEFIHRKGDDGFGEGYFKALFESIEEDQINRGVLKG